jgi:transitional endoplasmic reticulum ATPase
VKAVAASRHAGEPVAVNEVVLPGRWVTDGVGWVRLDSDRGSAIARCTGYDDAGDRAGDGDGPVEVRLGRHLWSRLVVRPGEALDVEVLDGLPVAERVLLDVDTARTDPVRDEVVRRATVIHDPLYRRAELDLQDDHRHDHDDHGHGHDHGHDRDDDHPADGHRHLGGRLTLRVREVRPEPAILGPGTVVDVVERDRNELAIHSSVADVGGSADILENLRQQIELPLRRPHLYAEAGITPPKGAILHGPPGTGKTLMLRAVARSLGVTVRALSGGELARSLRGETEKILRDLFRDAARQAPTVILIDEFDAIGGHRDRMGAQDDVRAVSQLLSLMDGLERTPGVVVMASTNRISAIDEAFLRPGRFDLQIKVGAPSEADRRQILDIHCRDMPLTDAARDELGRVARSTAGYVGADLMHLARLAALRAVERTATDPRPEAALAVEADDLRAALVDVRPSGLAAVSTVDSDADWDALVGLDAVKEDLLAAAESAFSPGARVGPPQGVVLYGPPGNGKSAIARALARELDVGLVSLEPARIFRPWLGESETALREVFERAELSAPAILVIEHLGALASAASSAPGERTDDRVKAALMAAMDETMVGGGVLVVGITRDLGDIDPQLVRSGRLGRHLHVPDPSADARRQLLLRRYSGQGPEPPVPVDELVAATEGRSAADILHSSLERPAHA